MSKTSVLNINGEKVKDITLKAELWDMVPNDAVMYDAIRLTRHSLRQGTHATKTRDEVRGGGKKPWRQKGTGRARHGSTRSPIWVGGGVVFGPTPRKYEIKMNRKERRLALKSALAYKKQSNELVVVESLNLDTIKTSTALKVLTDLGLKDEKLLIIVQELSDNLILATRNLKNIMLLEANEINVLDIVNSNKMLVTEEALKSIEEVLV